MSFLSKRLLRGSMNEGEREARRETAAWVSGEEERQNDQERANKH